MEKQITDEILLPDKLEAQINGHKVEAEVLSQLGANLASLKVDGRELIYFSREKLLQQGIYTGCFMMFPTPCSLTGAKYCFEGKEIRQKKYDEDVFNYGLIRDETFSVVKSEGRLLCSIEIGAGHPVYEGYPFDCRFSLEFELVQRGIEVKFKYENTGSQKAPFGYGLHPFWRISGERQHTFIQVPCKYAMELVDLIPTGEISQVQGTSLDLRSFKSLAEVSIDSVFCGRDVSSEHAIEFRDTGIKLTLESSKEFGFMIVYTPADEPFACMENLTCAPDAPNLYAKGKEKPSGLRMVGAGESVEGWVRYSLADL
jgi:aldose 1-epimerase